MCYAELTCVKSNSVIFTELFICEFLIDTIKWQDYEICISLITVQRLRWFLNVCLQLQSKVENITVANETPMRFDVLGVLCMGFWLLDLKSTGTVFRARYVIRVSLQNPEDAPTLSQFWPTHQTRKENFFDYLKKNINKFLIEVETRLTCPYLRASPLSRNNIFDTMT